MDIELLSRMIGELIVDHDQVGLPGVGTFVAEMVPASFSDRGFTINPPYRRLSFYPSHLEDTLLIDFYASSNRIDRESAQAYILQYLAELRAVLEQRKTVALPGLGRLRATRENAFFFVPDEGLDIFPAGIGLRPVSLKSHIQPEDDPVVINVPLPVRTLVQPEAVPTPEPEEPAVEEPVEEIPDQVRDDEEEVRDDEEEVRNDEEEALAAEPEPQPQSESESEPESEADPEAPDVEEPAVEEIPEEEIPDQVRNDEEQARNDEETVRNEEKEVWYDEDEPEETPKRRGWLTALVVVALLAAFALAAFMITAAFAPDFIDSILYTPEELEIINF